MVQYVDKDALVAEIERLIEINKAFKKTWKWKLKWFYRTIIGRLEVLEGLKNFINTLEVKEVDLNEEIEKCLKRHSMLAVGKKDFTDIAKHFFELGMQVSNKAQKGNDNCYD